MEKKRFKRFALNNVFIFILWTSCPVIYFSTVLLITKPHTPAGSAVFPVFSFILGNKVCSLPGLVSVTVCFFQEHDRVLCFMEHGIHNLLS